MSKKWKIALIILIVAAIAALATCIVIDFSSSSKFIIPDESIEYHTKDELTELYWQNEDLLNSVKDSILSSKAFLQVLIDQKDGDAGILTDYHKDLFTVEEWADIVAVFDKLHPYMIMMERKGRPLIFYIVCGTQKQDSLSKETYLYWFPNEEERKHHEEPGVFPDGVFTQIDGGWYIVEQTDSR
jgi:hypothetical protein